jgi:GntR family transcriptional regulator
MFENIKINKNYSEPLYFQLQNFIINEINSGRLKKGDVIPTEMELSKNLEISRPTVRQAMCALVNQGYLIRIKGKGTFVSKPKILQEYTSIIESYNKEMENKGLVAVTKVLELKVIEADGFISSKLQLQEKEKVIKLKRLRFAVPHYEFDINNEKCDPSLLTTVYIPFKLIPTLISYDFQYFSLYEVLEKNNLKVKKVIREMEAKLITEEWSRLLKVADGEPAHFITSIGYLEDDRVIEYSESIYPGNRNKFLIEILR